MQTGILVSVVLPLSLFIIMLGMGMSLKTDDFKRVLVQPKAFFVGFTAQMLLLPILALCVISVIEMDPLLAVGLMILSFCPGGTTSNMFTFLARGDVALSITLTAVVSLIAPFTIPLLANLTMDVLLGSGANISLPLGKTILTLLVITALPVGLGMLLNNWKPSFSEKMDKPVKVFSVVFLFLIIAGIVKNNWENMGSYLDQMGLAAILLSIMAMASGLGLALMLKLRRTQAISISFEVGIQNGTTALLITSTILNNDVMAISAAIYGLLMFVTGGIFGVLLTYFFPEEETESAAFSDP